MQLCMYVMNVIYYIVLLIKTGSQQAFSLAVIGICTMHLTAKLILSHI